MRKSSRFVVAAHSLAMLAYSKGEALTSDYIAGSVNTNPVVVRRILSMLARALWERPSHAGSLDLH